jgi:hypothetical protein
MQSDKSLGRHDGAGRKIENKITRFIIFTVGRTSGSGWLQSWLSDLTCQRLDASDSLEHAKLPPKSFVVDCINKIF